MEGQQKVADAEPPPSSIRGLGARHGQGVLMFLGLMVAYALRVNLSVGIVAMTDPTINSDFQTLDWSSAQKGAILAAFFWGYFVMQVPAGMLARKYGPCRLLAFTSIFCGFATLLTSVAATSGGWIAVCAVRVLQGLGQGFVYPSVNTHMSKWAVPQERARMYSFVFGGTQLGTILMLFLGGLLAASAGGWPSIYYTSGLAAICWGILCYFYGADSPDTHKSISPEERHYVKTNLNHTSDDTSLPTPWSKILTSLPLLALVLVHLAQNWGFWTLMTEMPTYINGVLGFDIQQNGFLSSLPYFAMWMMALVFGVLGDYLVKNKILSVHSSRKMWNSISHYGGALALIGLAYIAHDATSAITLLTISVALNAGCYLGYLLNHMDLAPNFAGTLMGLTNGTANITSVLAPLVAGLVVSDEKNPEQWRIVFLIAAAIFFVGNTIFVVFGSTDIQPWNNPVKPTDSEKQPEKS